MGHGGKRVGAGRKPTEMPLELGQAMAARIRPIRGRARRYVTSMTSYGASLPEIAAVLGIDQDTVSARFGEELKTGRALMEANALTVLWRKAMAGSAPALIWWLHRMGDLKNGK